QRAVLRQIAVDQERDRIRLQPARSCCDQQAERVRANEPMLYLDAILAEVRRLVHRLSSLRLARAATGPRTSATPTARGRGGSGRSAPSSRWLGCGAAPRPTTGSRTSQARAGTADWSRAPPTGSLRRRCR